MNNLAGKYVFPYGTPFDLEELKNEPALDVNHITHVRVVDVTGSVNAIYAQRDATGRIINDPWPTDFPNGGFDLDAVAVINREQPNGMQVFESSLITLSPNPCVQGSSVVLKAHFEPNYLVKVNIVSLATGELVTTMEGLLANGIILPPSSCGIHLIEAEQSGFVWVKVTSAVRYGIFLWVAVFYFSSCKEEVPKRPFENPTLISKGAFVTSEGNFQWGNASVTYYDFTDSTANATDLFAQKNNKPLGDICQSMYIHNSKAYLVLNNSSKIEVADAGSFVSIATIKGLVSPRYFLPVSDSKAYVTDLYANSVQVVDLLQNKVVKQIPLHGWTEELLLHNGKVYVTNLRSNYLYQINPAIRN